MKTVVFLGLLFIGISYTTVKAVKGDLNAVLISQKIKYTPEILYRISQLQELFFQYSGAAATLHMINEFYPESPVKEKSLFNLARLSYNELDNKINAVESLQTLLELFPETKLREEAEHKLKVYMTGAVDTLQKD
ncbi:MAG TPA: tetratricopeptide repeat protein [bacterium]|nr:tetratricopeptide repeat protein [bacterium]